MMMLSKVDGKLTINNSAVIQNIEEVREKSLIILENSDVLLFDFSDCTDIDLSAIQVIVAAGKSALTLGKRVSVRPDSQGVLLKTMAKAGFVDGEGKVIVGEKLFEFDKGQ
jgi:anti-anti-sigma regulatory factor